MKKTSFILIVLVTIIFISACSDSQTTSTAEPITVATGPPEESATQSPIPTPSSTATSPPSTAETSRILWVSSSTDLFNRVITVDPQNRRRLANCAPDEILHSIDQGQTWDAIPTSGVISAAEQNGYILFSGDSPSDSNCLSVTLDPNHPSSYYAVFTTASEQMGAPPVFYMGFFTTDGGETWQLVPTPDSSTLEDFGGFWNLGGDGIEALFKSDKGAENTAVIETIDGGVTWRPGDLSCPSTGPCVRWGSSPSNIPGMGSPLPQEILSSPDGGSTWESIEPPVELRAPAPNQLVAFSDDEIAIISGSIGLADPGLETSALRLSQDTGSSFHQVEIPPLTSSEGELNYFPGLQILPDDSYLSQDSESGNWFWLDPRMPNWCPLNKDRLPAIPQLLQSVGDQLGWINEDNNMAEFIPLSEIGCADK